MSWTLNSKAKQVGLVAAIFSAVTIAVAISTDSWAPIGSGFVWLPAIYVAIYHRSAGRRSHGQHG